MKNYQKGFIVPVLLAVIAVLIIGGGIYIYKGKYSETNIPGATQPTVTNVSIQTTSQAKTILENIRMQLGSSDSVISSHDFRDIQGYKLSVPPAQISIAQSNLSPIGESFSVDYMAERIENAYENWHLLCVIIGRGSGSSPSDLPYVWCGDKMGTQTISVVVKDIKNIQTNSRDFMLTIGNETMKVRMPAVVQNTNYQNGTYDDFVKAVTNTRYQNSTFKMTGEIKGDAFEVTSIQWILG